MFEELWIIICSRDQRSLPAHRLRHHWMGSSQGMNPSRSEKALITWLWASNLDSTQGAPRYSIHHGYVFVVHCFFVINVKLNCTFQNFNKITTRWRQSVNNLSPRWQVWHILMSRYSLLCSIPQAYNQSLSQTFQDRLILSVPPQSEKRFVFPPALSTSNSSGLNVDEDDPYENMAAIIHQQKSTQPPKVSER